MKGFGTEGIDADEIKRMGGRELFYSHIQPQMKQIVYLTLKACQDLVSERKNSVELYGYDFMIDSDFNTWIIEVNSSPSMDYSTKVTETLVKEVLTDAVKVILDYGQNKRKKQRGQIDTGKFHLITKKGRLML